MNTDLASFAADAREFIQGNFQGQSFLARALELFKLQFRGNPGYRAFCQSRGLGPDTPRDWTQIPSVPAAAFKELDLTSLAPFERTTCFQSSGTTGQKPSRHFHHASSLAVYEASLWQGFMSRFGNVNELVFLTPNPSAAPHSSLVHMFETLRRKSGLPEEAFTGHLAEDGSWAVDFVATRQKFLRAGDAQKPLTILGTAFSFVHLCDWLAKQGLEFKLPAGSRVMETGGYKNRSRILPKAELHEIICRRLGIALDNIISEYGMSELSSQAYAAADGRFEFPPWARVQIISPETGREAGEGETGLIRVLDLANVFSVAAVQTEDLGIRRGAGFELAGRAPVAEPRGCSLMTA